MQKQKNSGAARKRFDCLTVLKGHAVLGGLAPTYLRRLCALASVRKVAAGRTIFAAGEGAAAMFGICAGAVTLTPAHEPARALPALAEAGQVFGENALLGGGRRSSTAVAATDCDLIVFKRSDMLAAVLADPKFALKLIEVLAAQLRQAHRNIEEAASLTVPRRIARTLLHLVDAAGADGARLTVTQHELARTVRSSRESVNKCLRSWMRRKLIRLERGATTVIDRSALGAIANGRADGMVASSARRYAGRMRPA